MASFARRPDDTMTRQQDINGGGKTWGYEAAQLRRSLKTSKAKSG